MQPYLVVVVKNPTVKRAEIGDEPEIVKLGEQDFAVVIAKDEKDAGIRAVARAGLKDTTRIDVHARPF